MQENPAKSGRFATSQLIIGALAILIVAFLIIGTVNDFTAPEPEFSFGIQTLPFALLAFLAFAGGLLSFISPCTLPILPAYFAFAFRSGRTQIATNTMAFLLGLATMFSLLGAGASVIGQVLRQSSNLILLIGGAAIMIFGAISFLGKGFTGYEPTSSETRSTSLGGSYMFGLTFAVGWSSCVGPILGAVLTLAATTGSVLPGVMLLFIYALGLGLPLVIVSTLFGRTSRKSLFWRLLRGKGWHVEKRSVVVGLTLVIWTVAIWQVLAALAQYAFFDPFTGPEFTNIHNIGLLALAALGVALWFFTNPANKEATLFLHSTQIISGALFMVMGVLMLGGQLAAFNSLVPPDLALWFADFEDTIINFFS